MDPGKGAQVGHRDAAAPSERVPRRDDDAVDRLAPQRLGGEIGAIGAQEMDAEVRLPGRDGLLRDHRNCRAELPQSAENDPFGLAVRGRLKQPAPVRRAAHAYYLFCRERKRHPDILRDERHPPGHRLPVPLRHLLAQQLARPLVAGPEPREHREQGGLTRAVRSDKRNEAAACYWPVRRAATHTSTRHESGESHGSEYGCGHMPSKAIGPELLP